MTGFKSISASVVGPICTRHGRDYVAEMIDDTITLKFMPTAELTDDEDRHPERTSLVSNANLNTESAFAFESGIKSWLSCDTTSQKKCGDTVVFEFDVKSINKTQCDEMLASPAVSTINILPTGVQIVFALRTDSKNSLRYLKRNSPHLFNPKTSDPGWMHKPCSLTASRKTTHARKFQRKPKSYLSKAAAFLGF